MDQDELPEFEEMETEIRLVSIAASSAAYMAAQIMLPGQNLVASLGLFLIITVPSIIAGEMAVKHSNR